MRVGGVWVTHEDECVAEAAGGAFGEEPRRRIERRQQDIIAVAAFVRDAVVLAVQQRRRTFGQSVEDARNRSARIAVRGHDRVGGHRAFGAMIKDRGLLMNVEVHLSEMLLILMAPLILSVSPISGPSKSRMPPALVTTN